MGTVWTIVIGIHLCSLLFLALYIKRLFGYVRKYRMPESQYTLLLGRIYLSHFIIAYGVTLGVFIIFSLIFLRFLS